MRPLLALIGRNGTAMLAGGVMIGLLAPPLASLLRPYLSIFIFLMTAATFLRIDWRAAFGLVRRPMPVLLFAIWSLAISPMVTAAILLPLGLPAPLVNGIVLWAACGPITSAPAIALLLGLDAALALVIGLFATLLMPFTLPPMALLLIGVKLEIGVVELMIRLTLFLAGAMAAALVARRLAGPERLSRHAVEIDGTVVTMLVLFAIAIMDGVTALIVNRPAEMALYAVAAFLANFGLQVLTALAFWWQGRKPALTMGLCGGNNNMATVVASLGSAAGPDLLLLLALNQFPIYILPAALRPVIRRLLVSAP
jgi:BASS family bile acid:Na+ symporter